MFRFYDRRTEPGDRRSYAVDARPDGHPERLEALPGRVVGVAVSNDGKIGRLRKPQKPLTRWRAKVSAADAVAAGGRGGTELSKGGYWGDEAPTVRVEWRGQDCRTREEAAELLLYWHEHPELREGPAPR
jgi:hypothetical protein